MESAQEFTSQELNRAYILRVVLGVGSIAGILIALLKLVQGDNAILITSPLLLSIFSLVLLIFVRKRRMLGAVKFLTVIFYDFIVYPVIWINGHGFEGPVILYFLVLLGLSAILLEKSNTVLVVSFLLTVLTVSLLFLGPGGNFFQREYPDLISRRFDILFNLIVSGMVLTVLIRVVIMRNGVLEGQLNRSRTVDEFSGAFTRRRILGQLQSEMIRAGREDSHLCGVVATIHNYQQIHEDFGNRDAELILRRTAYILLHKSRIYDSIGRVGEGTFLCILPGTDEMGASEYIRRITEEYDGLRSVFNGINIDIQYTTILSRGIGYEDFVSRIDKLAGENT